MSETTAAAPIRALSEALRQVSLPRYTERQKLFGQRFEWSKDELNVHFRVRASAPTGHWMHGLIETRPLCIYVHPEQNHRIGERAWTDYQDDARLMAWTLLHDELLDTLCQVLGGSFTPINVVGSPASAAPELSGPVLEFDVPGSADNTTWRGALALDDETCNCIIDGARATPLEKTPDKWPDVPLPVALRCAGPILDASALRTCSVGDMIVLGERTRLAAGITACDPGGRPLPLSCQTEAEGVRIVLNNGTASSADHSNKEPLTMSQTKATPDGDPTLQSQIPVRLSIQTAAVDISLSELEQMESGMVVPLEVPVAGTNVTILANGAPIGDGELVAAGDKLAVCIRRWRPDGL